MIIPGNVYAASDLETKKAIESFYDEDGFMNKIWACELISRAFNTTGGREFTTKVRHKFALTQIMSDNYYRELADYLDSSPKTTGQWANNPLTERIYKTILGELLADPMDQDKYDIAFTYCTLSMVDFITLNRLKRENHSGFADYKEGYRKSWAKHIAEYPAPKIAGGPIGKSKTIAPSSKPVAQTTSSESSHERCLDAKDYEGCMRVQSGQATSLQTTNQSNCKPNEWCIASSGNDPLGRQKIEGWGMLYRPSKKSVLYLRPSAQKVNVRGNTDRYFQIETLLRHVVDPVSAIAPTSSTIGSAQTNCIAGYGNTVNCTTTPPVTIKTPGRAGSPGGVTDSSAIYIFDCKERTVGWHLDGQLRGKWRKPSQDEIRKFDKYCPIITTLKTSMFDKYSKK